MKATRDEIISLADWHIRKNGYNAFSYRDIALQMNVRNAAIHHYFPAKADLGIAVVQEEIKKVTVSKENNKDLSAVGQIKKLVEGFYYYGEKGLICLTGSMTPEYNSFPLPLQDKVMEMCNITLDWLSDCLEKARSGRDLHFQGTAADRALLVITSLLSSLLLSRVLGIQVFQRMMDQVLQDMGANWRIALMAQSGR
jgi:TetR/AcrR family transcriptional repressor of nem operon